MQLNEGLDYLDMKNQLDSTVTVDEYAAKMGEDSDIVTLTFKVKSKQAGKDLESWLELGYDYVLDANTSDGELEPGIWLVFAEMLRKSNVPKKIVQILKDLKTLTGLDIDDWTVVVDGTKHKADEDQLKSAILLTPKDYDRVKGKETEEELNEYRKIAGLENKNVYTVDEEIRKYITNAGL